MSVQNYTEGEFDFTRQVVLMGNFAFVLQRKLPITPTHPLSPFCKSQLTENVCLPKHDVIFERMGIAAVHKKSMYSRTQSTCQSS